MQAGYGSGAIAQSLGGKAKSKGKKAAKRLFRTVFPIVAPWLLTFIIIANIVGPIVDVLNAIVGFVTTTYHAIFDIPYVEDSLRVPWNAGEDVDRTAMIYQIMLDEKYQIALEEAKYEWVDPVTGEASGASAREREYYRIRKISEADESYKAALKEYWYDLMRDEHTLLSADDMSYILEKCYEKNEYMFEMDKKFYTYLAKIDGAWTTKDGELVEVMSEDGTTSTGAYRTEGAHPLACTSAEDDVNDKIYGNLSRSKVEGEIDSAHIPGDGTIVRRFASHWQDVMALASFFSYESFEQWGTLESSKYDPSEEPFGINDSRNYYVEQKDLDNIFALFEYKFSYFYDPISGNGVNKENSATYGEHTVYVEGTDAEGIDDGAEVKITAYGYDELQAKEYSRVAYHYRMIPGMETRFAIDSAPRYIYNSFDSYTFVYTSTNNVENYCPEEFEAPQEAPPEGMYLCGRWHAIDPYYFIEAVSVICPWYKAREPHGVRSTYNWVHDMVEFLAFYVDILPFTLHYERGEELMRLAELYNNKQVLLLYEGTRCPEMEEYVKQYEEWLSSHRPGWGMVVDRYSETKEAAFYGEKLKSTEEWYFVDEALENVPFPSYGVTYTAETPAKMAKTAQDGNADEDYEEDVWEGEIEEDDWTAIAKFLCGVYIKHRPKTPYVGSGKVVYHVTFNGRSVDTRPHCTGMAGAIVYLATGINAPQGSDMYNSAQYPQATNVLGQVRSGQIPVRVGDIFHYRWPNGGTHGDIVIKIDSEYIYMANAGGSDAIKTTARLGYRYKYPINSNPVVECARNYGVPVSCVDGVWRPNYKKRPKEAVPGQ